MSVDDENLVRAFCAAWSRRDIDQLLEFFTEDAVYHNMPAGPVCGHQGIREVFQLFVPPSEQIDWQMHNIASRDGIVFTERLDRFVMGGKPVELPVAGVFEIRDGKIAAWRDYFDMQTWIRQAT